ncbi:hypothetical protein [Bacteroides nordii]|jgi:hypothetical protein|uniref:hypothetical protein n=1 Tax=Bacteroides nordii TaxID=291645 RepID=UPI0022E1D89E|nr:hypothetical protein [Bacteroides nordii]
MDKLLICLFAFIGITFNGFSQTVDSLVNIKGYYVTRFLKDEIVYSYNQKIKRINNQSYSIPIDYTSISFFIPLDIDNVAINCSENVAKSMSFANNLNKDSIYYLPVSKQVEKYIKEVFNLNLNLSKGIAIFSATQRISPFYINTTNNKYLYKCIFVDGEALRAKLLNTEEKRFPLDIDVDFVNRKARFVDFFFIVKVNSYSTIINVEGLKEWVPYCDEE